MILGIFTDVSAIILFILYVIVFLKSKYYSIEDICFQNTLFHIPFIASGTYLSLDFIFQINSLFSVTEFFNSLFVSNALIMYSAGYEKLKSKMWLKGRGACLFVSLPHLVKKSFHFIGKKYYSFFMLAGYLIVFSEFTFLISPVHKGFFVIVLFVLIFFSILLFVIVDISFIGQVLLLNYLLFGYVLVQNWERFELKYDLEQFLWSKAAIVTAIINLFTLTTVVYYSFARKIKIDKLQKFLTGINSPIGVFNEKHLFGFYTYRLFFIDENNERIPVIEAFDDLGYPGKYQIFYPRYFQGAIYPITDFCLATHKYGVKSNFKESQMLDIMYCGLKSLNKEEGVVVLSVKKYDFDETLYSYSNQSWTDILECRFEQSSFLLKRLKLPPMLKKTFREVKWE
jgi:hypothetical protein